MEQIEYIGKIMDDGHIYLPETVRRQLKLKPDSSVHVILSVKETESLSTDQGWSFSRQWGKRVKQVAFRTLPKTMIYTYMKNSHEKNLY